MLLHRGYQGLYLFKDGDKLSQKRHYSVNSRSSPALLLMLRFFTTAERQPSGSQQPMSLQQSLLPTELAYLFARLDAGVNEVVLALIQCVFQLAHSFRHASSA